MSTTSTECRKRRADQPVADMQSDQEIKKRANLDPALAPTSLGWILKSESRLLLALIVFRICNAVTLKTSFVPDEYWQSVEIAHRWVYGRGYVTWEWIEHIRGTIHPLIFAALFQGMQLSGVDSPENLVSPVEGA